jgi:hypothetical protein
MNIEGSNPSLSANKAKSPRARLFALSGLGKTGATIYV